MNKWHQKKATHNGFIKLETLGFIKIPMLHLFETETQNLFVF